MVGATIALVAAASIGAAAVTGSVDDGQSTVPVVTSQESTGVTYTVSGSVPEQLISSRDVPVVQTVAASTQGGANGANGGTAVPGVQWPVDLSRVTITDGFGPRNSPCSGCSSNHRGLDMAGPQGTRIGSIANGIVIESVPTDGSGLGAHVVVEHRIDGLKVRSVYGHMVAGSPAVRVGAEVKTGQLLGLLGNTGASTGPHLHLEIIVDGTHVDPRKFLDKYADGKAVDIFGDAPTMSPPSGNPSENDGWGETPDTFVPPADKVPDTTVPPAAPTPSAPAGNTSSPLPAPSQPTVPSPSTSTPPSVEPESPSPSPSQSADPSPSTPTGENESETTEPTPES